MKKLVLLGCAFSLVGCVSEVSGMEGDEAKGTGHCEATCSADEYCKPELGRIDVFWECQEGSTDFGGLCDADAANQCRTGFECQRLTSPDEHSELAYLEGLGKCVVAGCTNDNECTAGNTCLPHAVYWEDTPTYSCLPRSTEWGQCDIDGNDCESGLICVRANAYLPEGIGECRPEFVELDPDMPDDGECSSNSDCDDPDPVCTPWLVNSTSSSPGRVAHVCSARGMDGDLCDYSVYPWVLNDCADGFTCTFDDSLPSGVGVCL